MLEVAEDSANTAAAARGRGAVRMQSAVILALILVDAVPLLGMLPAVSDASLGTVGGYTLLPLLAFPTALAAARLERPLYIAQVCLAAAVCLVTVFSGPHTWTSRLVGAVATVGALILIATLVANGRRQVLADYERLKDASSSDPLTGALNRRGLAEQHAALIARAGRADLDVGIAAIDLDHFKRINDSAGHDVGDQVITRIVDLARRAVGVGGLVVRSGGEEFLAIVIGDAVGRMESLRRQVASSAVRPRVTISVGVVTARPDAIAELDDMWDAIAAADRALYRAKSGGRNQVVDGGQWPESDRGDPAPGDEYGDRHDDDPDHGDPRAVESSQVQERGPTVVARPDSPTAGKVSESRAGSAWQAAVARAKDQYVDARSRLIYQVAVVWMVIVGMITTLQQAGDGSGGLAPTGGMFGLGIVIAAVAVIWLRRVDTLWQLAPLLAVGTPFEMIVVFTVPPEARPAALMLVLLAALMVVTRMPGLPMVAQGVMVVVSCVGAAFAPGRPDGAVIVVAALTAVPLLATIQMMGAIRTAQQGIEDGLREAASTDPLTGLGNRRALAQAAKRWQRGGVVMVDIDHFKALNDRYGHAVGDLTLTALAASLARAAHPGAQAFRIGGDEFVIAGPTLDAAGTAARLSGVAPGLPVPASVTVGAAAWPGADGGDLWTALARADQRLLKRKRSRHRRDRSRLDRKSAGLAGDGAAQGGVIDV